MKNNNLNRRRRMSIYYSAWLIVAGILLYSANVLAFTPSEDGYTTVRVEARIASGMDDSGDTNVNGSVGHSADFFHDPTFSTVGTVSGGGFASFTSLGAWVQVEGAAVNFGRTTATFNEAFNIAPPPGSQVGDQAELLYQFVWDGVSTISSASQAPQRLSAGWSARLSAVKWPAGQSGQTVGSDTASESYVPCPSCGVVPIQTNHYAYLTVPYTYGEQFGVSISLGIFASPGGDIFKTDFNPYFEYYGSSVDWIYADFSNTASIVSIVMADNPSAQLIGASGTDYTSLVTAAVLPEVPLPTAAWLFGSALLGLGVFKRKTA